MGCTSAEFSRWRDLSVSTAPAKCEAVWAGLNGLVYRKVEIPGGHIVNILYWLHLLIECTFSAKETWSCMRKYVDLASFLRQSCLLIPTRDFRFRATFWCLLFSPAAVINGQMIHKFHLWKAAAVATYSASLPSSPPSFFAMPLLHLFSRLGRERDAKWSQS